LLRKVSLKDERYLEVAFNSYHENNITLTELADYLDINIPTIKRLEKTLY
jgi:predicted HTH domain antitoxin